MLSGVSALVLHVLQAVRHLVDVGEEGCQLSSACVFLVVAKGAFGLSTELRELGDGSFELLVGEFPVRREPVIEHVFSKDTLDGLSVA